MKRRSAEALRSDQTAREVSEMPLQTKENIYSPFGSVANNQLRGRQQAWFPKVYSNDPIYAILHRN